MKLNILQIFCFFIISTNLYAFTDVEMAKGRECIVQNFNRAPYLPGGVVLGTAVETRANKKLSLQDLLDDKPISFHVTSMWHPNSVWRYSKKLDQLENKPNSRAYLAGSIMGDILLTFKKNDKEVTVNYTLDNNQESLFTLICDL